MEIENLDREDLLFLIGCYNNYVVDFFEEHEEGMYPVSVYEFYENEFQVNKTRYNKGGNGKWII